MTDNTPLRLVIDRGDRTVPALVELPPTDAPAVHFHIHVSAGATRGTPQAGVAEPAPGRKPDGGWGRPLMLSCFGVMIAAGAFSLGSRAGHAPAPAAQPASLSGVAALGANPAAPAASPAAEDQMPAIRQQLAQPPTIVNPNPAGATPGAASNDPFGLQR